jgi:predicted 3-demethylubiquinone-9 3-methyltransferase (glyoxalase superfamily)
MITQKITPFLWYQKDALAIGRYYQSVFGSQNVEIVGEDQGNIELNAPEIVVSAKKKRRIPVE